MSEEIINTAIARPEPRFFPLIEVGERKRGRPLALYFVYAPKGNVVIRGNADLVQEYLKIHFPVCLYYYSFWKEGKSRGNWVGHGISLLHRPIFELSYDNFRKSIFARGPKKARYAITGSMSLNSDYLFYRNLPNKWLPEWDAFAVEYAQYKARTAKPKVVCNPEFSFAK